MNIIQTLPQSYMVVVARERETTDELTLLTGTHRLTEREQSSASGLLVCLLAPPLPCEGDTEVHSMLFM